MVSTAAATSAAAVDAISELPLAVPDDFSFPYATTYEIQTTLMRHVYQSIEERAAAVAESPTGTGKSLSLICSTLTWLRDDAERAKKTAIDSLRVKLATKNANEPKWMVEQELKRRIRDFEANEREMQERLEALRAEKVRKQDEMRSKAKYARKRQKLETQVDQARSSVDDEDDDQFAPDEIDGQSAMDARVQALLDGPSSSSNGARWRRMQEEEDEPDVRKIYFTSRTHSQLSQFLSEVRKTSFSPGVRTIALGSRGSLCINDKMREKSRGSAEALNDLCLDLQKAEKGKRCQYLPPLDEPERLENFRDHALAEPRNIEDLEDLGRELHTCPYYGARKAIRQAQLVTLPYNLLLLKQARDSLGIKLDDHVVVIDEAHNLIDTILSIHSVEISSAHLSAARAGLVIYIKRFQSRLKGRNATYLKQLLGLLGALDKFCKAWLDEKKTDEMIGAQSLTQRCAADQVNLRELDKYLTESKIAQKISGYMEKLESIQEGKGEARAARSAKVASIHRIQTFLLALANAEKDGRVLISSTPSSNGSPILNLKYQLLNPSEVFSDFSAARSVVIAGGTMAPLSDFASQLLSYLPASKIRNLSCSHVVPASNILARTLSAGPTGYRLEYKYDARGDTKMADEYGATLLNICTLVKKGVVCFVPSYRALDAFLARWQASGIMNKLKAKRSVFQEPKAGSESDAVLREYAAAIADTPGGAILFAVVGAKLSEGINFQDDLCRCVVVIGIPYPNSQSTELRERMKYVSSLPQGNDSLLAGEAAGKRLYSNLAFRAVNQSIGRSIRHANDWSAILLLDARYSQPATQTKLPTWISSGISTPATFGGLVRDLAGFMKVRAAAAGRQTGRC